MLVVMERKFVVTKTNVSDGLRDRETKEQKIVVFAQSGHLRFSLTCGPYQQDSVDPDLDLSQNF